MANQANSRVKVLLACVQGLYCVTQCSSWFCQYCNHHMLCPLVIKNDILCDWAAVKSLQDVSSSSIHLVSLSACRVLCVELDGRAWVPSGKGDVNVSTWLKWEGPRVPGEEVYMALWLPGQSVTHCLASVYLRDSGVRFLSATEAWNSCSSTHEGPQQLSWDTHSSVQQGWQPALGAENVTFLILGLSVLLCKVKRLGQIMFPILPKS